MDENDREREKPQIKVTDRRLFDQDGNLREPTDNVDARRPEAADSAERERRPSVTPPTEAPEPRADPAPAAQASEPQGEPESTPQTNEPAAGDSRRAATDPDDHSPANLPRDFAGFVQSQYYETMLYLGAMPHPATGEVIEDLPMAQYKIDLLTMLQEKTEGNRTADESTMLDGILYQVRMAFLQKSKVVKL